MTNDNDMTDEQTLRERLENEQLSNAPWEALRTHAERGGVFVVRHANLLDVGEAFAADDTARVSAWLQDGALMRPTDAEQATFLKEEQTFNAIIVQPWVLIQPSGTPADA